MENPTVVQNWKTLIKPNKLNIKSNEDKTITTVIAEPLEKGYALTIGNALRRILLSSIQGSAITAIQIDGVLHEFSSIKGVREDVTDIVLNVKTLSLKVINLKASEFHIINSSDNLEMCIAHTEDAYKKSITKSLSETVSIELPVGSSNFSFRVV